tara:strand:+ start:80 stop:529 length:450 start_codon:yes stop_codon:yes gene_type:complete
MTTTLELEQQVQDYLKTDDNPVSFEQKEDIGFEMPKLPFLDSGIVVRAIGASLASVAGGTIGHFLPAQLQAISGMPQLVIGTVGKYVLRGKGTSKLALVVDGVLISGLSQVITGLISRGGFTQEVKEMFQQKVEQPKEERSIGVEGVRW